MKEWLVRFSDIWHIARLVCSKDPSEGIYKTYWTERDGAIICETQEAEDVQPLPGDEL